MIYYNENNADAAAKLRALIAWGLVPRGDVDDRSIEDVTANDLRGYEQVHLFAGIGTWAAALARASWPVGRRVWTGSCPCQPFSAAGKGLGTADERHLWPAFFHLILQCRPPVIYGEQVAGRDGLGWFDLVRSDLEAADYTSGAVDTPAAGYGAPHIRQRIHWMAHLPGARPQGRKPGWKRTESQLPAIERDGSPGRVAYDDRVRLEQAPLAELCAHTQHDAEPHGDPGGLADLHGGGPRGRPGLGEAGHWPAEQQPENVRAPGGLGDADSEHAWRNTGAGDSAQAEAGLRPGPTNGFWRDVDWLGCRDGKWRPVEPQAQCMVDGLAAALDRLHADGEFAKEVRDVESRSELGLETVRALWQGDDPETIWGSLGGRIGFSQASLLLAALLQRSWQLGAIFSLQTPMGLQERQTLLRTVWPGAEEAARTPQGRGCPEQLAEELGDAMSQLSQAAPSARSHLKALNWTTGHVLANDVPGRVGALRAAGNGIVLPQTVAFIEASMT